MHMLLIYTKSVNEYKGIKSPEFPKYADIQGLKIAGGELAAN